LVPLIALAAWYSLAAAWPTPAAVSLTRGPYLQSVTTDTIVVVWETDEPGDSRVEYGPTASYTLSISDTALVTHHAITLTGMSPYTTVHYRASTNGQPMGSDSTFRTAAALTQTDFSFVAFGDTRTDHVAHQGVVDAIRAVAPDFTLHTGDLVENGGATDQWDTFFDIERELMRQAPLFGSLGNHESNHPNYLDAFHLPGNERWYSFDYGHIHFVALQIDGYANYAPGSQQFAWLEKDLANTDRPWKVVFFHIPPYSSGRHGSDLSVRTALGPLFEQYGVDLVFSGHDHDYERSFANGVVYIVTGGGGAPLYDKETSNPYSVYWAKTYHFVLVEANKVCLRIAGVRPDGTRFDKFLVCDPALLPFHLYLPVILRRFP
jgi:3',5'-cyclic AMP phosphodiesterase CpdA